MLKRSTSRNCGETSFGRADEQAGAQVLHQALHRLLVRRVGVAVQEADRDGNIAGGGNRA